MATDIGNVYLDVYADTKALKGQIRRAAKAAGKDFGKEFEKSATPGLSGVGDRLMQSMGKNGRLSGKAFTNEFVSHTKGVALGFDTDIARAFSSGDWDSVFANFDDLDDAVERTDARLRELNKGGTLTKALKEYGFTLDDVRGSMRAYADETRRAGAEVRQRTEQEKALADQMKLGAEMSADITRQQREQQSALQDQMRLGLSMHRDTEAALKNQQKLLNNATLRNATADTQALGFEYKRVQEHIKDANQALLVFRKAADTDVQKRNVALLAQAYDQVQDEINETWRTHQVALTRMERGTKEYAREVARASDEVADLQRRLRLLATTDIDIEVDVDTPGKVAMTIAGAIDGHAYQQGFEAATDGGLKKSFQRNLMMLAQAFPAAVTLLFTPFGLAIGAAIAAPIATLASTIGGILTAALSAAAVAAGGLALALAGVGVAGGYAFALAKRSMDIFKEKFPEVQAGIDDLKNSFENIDAGRFAQEWSESLTKFTHTLADSLEFDTIAENLGKATARITDAFTGILESAAWDSFVKAIEGPFSRALGNFGVGLASMSSVLLTWLTAAAPLAEYLGVQFERWAAALKLFFESAEGQAQLTNFIRQAGEALNVIVPLVADLGEAFGNIFTAGADAGIGMLGVIGDLAAEFKNWTGSIEGQNQLAEWFGAARQIFDALLPVITAIGGAIGAMVTPRAVDMLDLFLGSVARIIPFLGDLFNVIGDLGLLDLFAEALAIIAETLRPLLPLLDAIAIMLHDVGADVLAFLAPILIELGAIFGRLADSLIPLIQPIGDLIGALLKADSLGITKAFEDFTAALEPAMEGLVDFIGEIVDFGIRVVTSFVVGLAQIIPALADGLLTLAGGLVEAISETIPKLIDMVQEIGPKIAKSIQTMIPALLTMATNLFEVLTEALDTVIPEMMASIREIVPDIIDVISNNVPMMVEAGKDFFEGLSEALDEVLPELMEAWQAIAPALIEGLVEIGAGMVTAAVDLFMALVEGLNVVLPVLIPAMLDGITLLIENIGTLVPAIITAGITLFMGFVEALALIVPPVIEAVGKLIPEIVEALKVAMPILLEGAVLLFTMLAQGVTDNTTLIEDTITALMPSIELALTDMMPQLITAATTLFTAIGVGVAEAMPEILLAISEEMPAIMDELDRQTPALVRAAGELFGAIALGVGIAMPKILGTLAGELSRAALTAAGQAAGMFASVGTAMITGMITGIGNAAGRLARSAAEAAGGAWQAAKDAVGMGSPAKRFIPIGESTMQGWQVGVERAMPAMVRATAAAGAAAAGAFAPGSSASTYGVNPSRGGGNPAAPAVGRLAGATVASGAIQIITPTRDPALVANMVLDGIVDMAV